MAFDRRIRCSDDIPFIVDHLGYHMRLHQIAAVCNGRCRGNHLNGRNTEVLTKGFGRQFHGAHCLVVVNTAGLARQVDARLLGKSKRFKILKECFRA